MFQELWAAFGFGVHEIRVHEIKAYKINDLLLILIVYMKVSLETPVILSK